VPCERVFSSSKQTDDHWQTNMTENLMEVLQISKYLHCNERLNFTGGLLATEEECSVIDISLKL